MTELQKASLSKRLAAGLLDAMLICVVATGVAVLLMWMFGFDAQTQKLADHQSRYMTMYQVDQDAAPGSLEGEAKANYEKAMQAFYADDEAMHQLSLVISQTFLFLTLSILLAMTAVEFVVPLLLKNGQTLGKKVFGLALMRVDGVQVTPVQMFVRSVLGKYAMETMVTAFLLIMIAFGALGIVGYIVIFGILLLQAICMIVSRTNSMVHDLMAATVVVDFASQRIFRSSEELLEYQKEIAAEQAARQDY